ncbi:hypothetical protein Tco_1317709 [Tanacetum coccineum]
MKEVRKKSLRDLHKTHPSGSGTVVEKSPSVEKITPTVTSEGTGDKLGVPDVTNDDSSESKSESWGNDEDDSKNEQESSDESSKQENESEEQESDLEQDEESDDDDQEEEEFDQENESKDDEMKRIVLGEGNDTEMIEAQQGNENLETTQEQVVKDAHVIISTILKKTEVPVTSSSRSSNLASKFLNFLDIPQTDAEIVSPLDVHVHHEVPRTQALTLLTIPVSVIPESSPLIKESRDEVTLAKSTYEAASTLTEFELKKILLDKMKKSESYLTAPEHRYCYDGLKKSYALKKYFFYSYDVYSLKRGREDKDKDEDPSAGSDRGLKKRKTSKDAELTTGLKKKDSTSGSSKGTKTQPKSSGKSVQSEEQVFEVADSDMPQDHKGNTGDNEYEPRKETASRSDWFKKPTPPQEPTDPDWHDFDELMSTPIDFSSYVLNSLKIKNLTKEILLGPAFRLLKGTRSNYAELEYDFEESWKRKKVPFEFFINNDFKYLQGGILTMTYMTSTTKTKAAKYDLPGVEDMVPNIWSSVKVAYDRYVLWVTHVKVLRKHGYGYLEEIVVRRADNTLYRFKEGDDVADFTIALRMFTRSLVIQKRLEHAEYDESNTYVLERFNTTAGNPVKKILLKLNLSDHRSILTDSKEYLKMVMEVPDSS